MNDERLAVNRRRFFECLSAMGLGSTLMPDALTIAAQDSDTITIEMIEAAQTIAGISFTREEQQAIVTRLNATRGYMAGFRFLQTANLGNSTQPAIVFNPVPPGKALPAGPRGPASVANRSVSKPSTDEALAFLPVTHLAKLVETRQVKPSELTELYLARLTNYDPDAPLRRQPHGGSGAGAGEAGRRRDRRRPVSWSVARDSLRAEGPVRGSRDEDDLGHLAVQGSGHRHRRHGVHEAEERRRDPGRETVDRRARVDRTVVRRRDAKPLEHAAGRVGLVGRPGLRHGCGAGGLFDRDPTRAARSFSRPLETASPACGRRSAESADTARWRWRGRRTPSARCAARPRIARSCSTPSTAPTEKTTASSTCRSDGTPSADVDETARRVSAVGFCDDAPAGASGSGRQSKTRRAGTTKRRCG